MANGVNFLWEERRQRNGKEKVGSSIFNFIILLRNAFQEMDMEDNDVLDARDANHVQVNLPSIASRKTNN